MGLRRACSYQATFRTPEDPINYSEILVTLSQKGQQLINKYRSSLTLTESTVILQLTQEETAQFVAGIPAQIQIRCYGSAYNAPGSAAYVIEVWPALNDEILGGE